VDELHGGEFLKFGFGISEFVKAEPWMDTHNLLIATVVKKNTRVGMFFRKGDLVEVFEKA